MPIRDYSQPSYMGVSPQLRDVLQRNGMIAKVMLAPDNQLRLFVQSHDSPEISYPITEEQVRKLSRAGGATGSDLKAAYKLFTSIVGNDFYMPVDLTHAKNVNNRVSMGLHGYRVGVGEPGSNPYSYRPLLGWTPRQQGGFHLRRMGGTVFMGGGPYVPDRPGSRMKPGELAAGGYGFYWKGTVNGQSIENQATIGNAVAVAVNLDSQQQLLDQLSNITLKPTAELPKPKKYSQEITSDVYFTTDKFLEVLTSHGILLDRDAKTMTIRSASVDFDMQYNLTDKDLAVLTDDSLRTHPLQERIDLINSIYGKDFKQKLTFAELDSDRALNFEIADHVKSNIPNPQLTNGGGSISEQYGGNGANLLTFSPQNVQLEPEQVSQQPSGTTPIYVPQQQNVDAQEYYKVQAAVLHADPKRVAQVNGEDINFINPDKGWYREGSHGRAVTVDQIIVYPIDEGDNKKEKYMMTAVINGEMISHKISEKDYDKFLALDDFHRMKLFSKIFPEVDLKDHNPVGLGTKIVAGLAAGLTVASEVMRPAPTYGGPCHGHRSVYFKPGVDTPQDIAHRAFEAGMNAERMDHDLHHGW